MDTLVDADVWEALEQKGWNSSRQMDAIDEWGATPLLYALRSGMEREARELLNAGASPDPTDIDGNTALALAIRKTPGMIPFFIERQWQLTSNDGKGALHMAALGKADNAVVRRLIALGLDVNATDGRGVTPILQACGGRRDLIPLLLEEGADAGAIDDEGADVFQWLFRSPGDGQARSYIRLLIEAGAGGDEKIFIVALEKARSFGLGQVLLDTATEHRRQEFSRVLPEAKSMARRRRM